MPLKAERFILGTQDFNKFGFSLQGEGLIPRNESESVLGLLLPELLSINTIEAINTKDKLIQSDSKEKPESLDSLKTFESREKLEILLKDNCTLFSSHDFDVGSNDLLACYIHLKPDAIPHSVPPRRLSLKLQEEEAKQIKTLLEHKLIEPSFSCWATGITFDCREGKTPRLCGDYRVLNSRTISDKYPIPRIDCIIMNLKDAKIYPKLDLTRWYNNIKIAEKDRYKTAFITNKGLYQWTRMPFGLKNSPAVFQRYMEIVISKCSAFAKVYFDDILIFSYTKEEHLKHLEATLKELERFNVKLKKQKCIFMTETFFFCGYVISNGSIRRDKSFFDAIDRIQCPSSIKDLYKFMGLANYGRNFVQNFAQIEKPLNQRRKKDVQYIWEPMHQECFDKLKDILKSAPTLYLFDRRLPTILYTDASNYTIGAVLVQMRSQDPFSKGGESKKKRYRLDTTQKRLMIRK